MEYIFLFIYRYITSILIKLEGKVFWKSDFIIFRGQLRSAKILRSKRKITYRTMHRTIQAPRFIVIQSKSNKLNIYRRIFVNMGEMLCIYIYLPLSISGTYFRPLKDRCSSASQQCNNGVNSFEHYALSCIMDGCRPATIMDQYDFFGVKSVRYGRIPELFIGLSNKNSAGQLRWVNGKAATSAFDKK